MAPKMQKRKTNSGDGDVHQNPTGDAVEVSEIERAMSVGDKLRMIDQEVRLLHQFCIEQGYNPWQIQEKAAPLLNLTAAAVNRTRRKKYGATLFNLLKLAVVVAVVTALVYYDPAYGAIRAHSRLAAIQIIPYWDWSQLYNENCLFENPYYVGDELKEEDCVTCENLTLISRVSNLSPAVMTEDHLKPEIPLIVTDAMTDWPAVDKFTVKFLDELYSSQEDLKRMMPCVFDSNVDEVYDDPRVLLPLASSGKISHWFANWENCDKQSARILRQFYRRPYFVPPNVELAYTNWIFVASHYNGTDPKPVNVARNVVLFAQLRGSSKMHVVPNSPCNATCHTLYATLHKGEILVVTDLAWKLEYVPTGSSESLALGIGGSIDL